MKADWPDMIEALPPNLTLSQAAQLLHRPYASVRHNLIRLNYPWRDGRSLRFAFGQPVSRVPWEKVNWRLSNIVIAHRYRVSRELVRRIRNRLGKPFVEARGRKPMKGNSHARSKQKTAEVHGHVQTQPRSRERQVPLR